MIPGERRWESSGPQCPYCGEPFYDQSDIVDWVECEMCGRTIHLNGPRVHLLVDRIHSLDERRIIYRCACGWDNRGKRRKVSRDPQEVSCRACINTREYSRLDRLERIQEVRI